VDWIDLAQNRGGSRACVNVVTNIWSYIKYGEFLDKLRACQFLRKDPAPRSWELKVYWSVWKTGR